VMSSPKTNSMYMRHLFDMVWLVSKPELNKDKDLSAHSGRAFSVHREEQTGKIYIPNGKHRAAD